MRKESDTGWGGEGASTGVVEARWEEAARARDEARRDGELGEKALRKGLGRGELDPPFSIIRGDGLPALLAGADIGVVCGELNLEGRIRGMFCLMLYQCMGKVSYMGKRMQKAFQIKKIKRERKEKRKRKNKTSKPEY
jgi:hypothetical protein